MTPSKGFDRSWKTPVSPQARLDADLSLEEVRRVDDLREDVIVDGRSSGHMLSTRNRVAVDIVHVANGVLVEHRDVLQDEATKEEPEGGLPLFERAFPVETVSNRSDRRI